MSKITIASTKETWYTQSLEDVTTNDDISIQTQNISCIDDLSSTGDVIYWRSSSIESDYPTVVQRSRFLIEAQRAGKTIVNKTLLTDPFLSYKSYQQSFVKTALPKINTISTFTAITFEDFHKLIDNGTLSFPFIAKPDHGSQGADIILVNSNDDLKNIEDISRYIFQNFIPNDGDYRVYIIGGVAVEIIKRTSSDESFLNNISQGATAQRVDNIELRETLATMATHIATTMDLSICGVDIMKNADDGQYYFLEVNTVAQWKGLQSVSNVNIAQCIIDHLTSITTQTRKNNITPSLIKDYYDKNLEYLPREKQFHFCSRMHLMTNDTRYSEKLEQLKSWYTWDADKLQNSINNILKNSTSYIAKITNNYDFRIECAAKYPLLGAYNQILYKTLFTKTIYGIDYRKHIANLLRNSDIGKYRKLLANDNSAIFALSTHAINFIYLSSWLFDDTDSIDVTNLFTIAQNEKLENESNTILSRIYLLTHSIICKSLFYSQEISQHKPIYINMLKELEAIITTQYTTISLDQKCEFLVCAKMLQYKTHLQETISNEIQSSLSPHGNYIVDVFNTYKSSTKKDLTLSEHRNVLYLLSN